MRIWQHLLLTVTGEFLGFVFGALVAVLVAMLIVPGEFLQNEIFSVLLLAGSAMAGVLGARWICRSFAARCPACGGRAFQRGHRPICYDCERCGKTHQTRVRSNW